jgi:hypothetical protein
MNFPSVARVIGVGVVPLSEVASAAPTNTARTVTAIATGNIAPASIRFLWSYGAYANRQR